MRRPIDATLHGAVDYSAAALLVTALPRLVGLHGTRSGRQIRLSGAIHGGYSALTDYPLGLVKLIPFQAHLASDAIGALTLGAAPFVSGQYRSGPRHWVPHVALCLFELASLALTDPTGEGDFHGDIDAIRRGNSVQPHRKIRDGGLAVTPAHA